MANCPVDKNKINAITDKLIATYADGLGVNPNCVDKLPRRAEVIELTENLIDMIFPGFNRGHMSSNTASQLSILYEKLLDQICRASRNDSLKQHCECGHASECCGTTAMTMLEKLPEIREILKEDVKAAYNGDPAATNFDEIVLSYPGIRAVAIQRLAHVLYEAKVPMLPRMMTEYAHEQTGIDIHPGANIGKGLFIDHGTGVVIGETAVLGDNVRIYQGVTLGAGNFPKDENGMIIKGQKRHPTIGNNVTIYSGASVLGNITIGDNSVVGGNVWLTESLPPGTKITASQPKNRLKFAEDRKK
jgi:serine O-acetyltransferase